SPLGILNRKSSTKAEEERIVIGAQIETTVVPKIKGGLTGVSLVFIIAHKCGISLLGNAALSKGVVQEKFRHGVHPIRSRSRHIRRSLRRFATDGYGIVNRQGHQAHPQHECVQQTLLPAVNDRRCTASSLDTIAYRSHGAVPARNWFKSTADSLSCGSTTNRFCGSKYTT